MDSRQYLTRRNIILTILFVVVAIAMFVAFDNLVFRLKSISPSLENMPDSATELRLHFSQPVESIGDVSLNDTVISPKINDRLVIIPLGRTLESDTDYMLVIKDVKSKWFSSSIASIKRDFTAKYVAFNQLSEEERESQIKQSNSGQVDDAFISNNVFPIFNERWQIDATVDTTEQKAFLNVKFFDEVPNYDNGGEVTRVSNDTAEKYRKEVLDEIVKRKGNPSDYQIFYDNPYLADKYPSTEEH